MSSKALEGTRMELEQSRIIAQQHSQHIQEQSTVEDIARTLNIIDQSISTITQRETNILGEDFRQLELILSLSSPDNIKRNFPTKDALDEYSMASTDHQYFKINIDRITFYLVLIVKNIKVMHERSNGGSPLANFYAYKYNYLRTFLINKGYIKEHIKNDLDKALISKLATPPS